MNYDNMYEFTVEVFYRKHIKSDIGKMRSLFYRVISDDREKAKKKAMELLKGNRPFVASITQINNVNPNAKYERLYA